MLVDSFTARDAPAFLLAAAGRLLHLATPQPRCGSPPVSASPGPIALAAQASAFAFLAIGDPAAVDREVARAVVVARADTILCGRSR